MESRQNLKHYDAMHHESITKKIPGHVVPPQKREGQGYIDDLSSKHIFELEELLNRQNNLLNNKRFVSKLPDKGSKIIDFRDKILRELQTKNDIDKAANLLSRLNIASEGKAAMNELEWTGKYTDKSKTDKVVQLDSDDEDDPLKILAQPTGSGVHKKKVIHLPPEETLIRPEDLEEIETFNDSVGLEHIKYIIDKVEKPKTEGEKESRESFKPYKTTKSNVHDPSKELERKRDKYWEVTAATPPPSIHGTVKPLNIEESLLLQKQQAEKLQDIQTRNAIMRLGGLSIARNIKPLITEDTNSTNSDIEDEEIEVRDDDDEDKGGTVVFTVEEMES